MTEPTFYVTINWSEYLLEWVRIISWMFHSYWIRIDHLISYTHVNVLTGDRKDRTH